MKNSLIVILLFLSPLAFAQSVLPNFLIGTWHVEGKESIEHWDKTDSETLLGLSYQQKNGQLIVNEYLKVGRKGRNIIYTATVLKQNQGRSIDFKLTHSDTVFIFENTKHDFPQQIVYQKISDTKLRVQVLGANGQGYLYNLLKRNTEAPIIDSTKTNPLYDSALSKKLGADDYGMKTYFWVVLKTGPNTTTDSELIKNSFKGHMNNIQLLVNKGQLIVAGPLAKNDNNYRGLFILNNLTSVEEVKEILLTDPAIKNGLLDFEIFKWYGSAALPEYLPFADKIWTKKP